MEPIPKTPVEVAELKQAWLRDPCWDIEDTEGFEDHREELQRFAQEQRQKWEQARVARLDEKAAELGCQGNRALAQYVMDLERRLEDSEHRVARLEDRVLP